MSLIEINVNPGGEPGIETRGFAGAACRDVSGFLEQALGTGTTEHLTSEFHQEHAAVQALRQSQ